MQRTRYLEAALKNDALAKGKMAFISGPRQVGKSTLAKGLLESPENYFLYEEEDFRRAWLKSPANSIGQRSLGVIVLDEIHKDRPWKRKLKGIYDTRSADLDIVVTGSARLDYFRRGSDSLLGRYLPYRLHPFSVAESPDPAKPGDIFTPSEPVIRWDELIKLGGFPEPLLASNEQEALRWSRLRLDRLVLEDSRDFLAISDQMAFRGLIDLLPERVGSPLSIQALREDLSKAHGTVQSWLNVLEALYYVFLVRPFGKSVARAIRSQPKLYLYDILRIPSTNRPSRLENLAALHLLKSCHYWTDTAQGEFELKYVRDKEKREVDFLVLLDGKPWLLVECKSNERTPNRNLAYFSGILKPKFAIQLVDGPAFDRTFASSGIRIMDYERFFCSLV